MKSNDENNICKISLLNLNTWIRCCIGVFLFCAGGALSFLLFRSHFPMLGYILAGIVLIIVIHLVGEFHYLIADSEKRTVTWSRGIIFTTSRKTIDFKDITEVVQEKEIHSRKNDSVSYYIAKLQTKGKEHKKQKLSFSLETSIDPEKGEIFKSQNQFRTRKIAEQLAEFLKRPLLDKTRGKTVIRSWDELDMSIAEKWSREEKKPERPLVPDFMLDRVDEVTINGINSTSIRIPSFIERYPKVLFVFLSLIILLLSFIAYQLWSTKDISGTLLSGWGSFCTFILLVATVLFLKGLTSKKVRVNETQINILYKYAGFLPWFLKLDSSEIEEIDFTHSSLALVTDKRIVTIVDHGEKGEAQFCLSIIKYTLKPASYSSF